MTLFTVIHPFSTVAADLLVNSLWQGLLLTAAVAVCLKFLPELTASMRSIIWTVVLLLMLGLPALPLLLIHSSHGPAGVLRAEYGWGMLLLGVWATASLYRGLHLGREAMRLYAVARRARVVVPDPSLAALLRTPRRALLCVSDEVDRPSVAGFFHARILLPPALLKTLTPAELGQVVLHEMEHLRRGDDWLNLLQQVSLVLLPLNPALLWVDRRLCRERELACDDGVLRATRARKAYAACLVKLAEDSMLRRGVSLALSALGTRARESELVSRVRRILAASETGVATSGRGRLVAGAALAVCVGIVMLVTIQTPQLVSFGDSAILPAQLPAVATVVGPAREPARQPVFSADHPGARPLLTSAVLTSPTAASRRLVAVASLRTPSRGPRRSGVATRATRWTPLPLARGPRLVNAHVVLAEYQFSQPVYAALPWRGGWLIVQL